ncbi:MAG: hypothetical protein F4X52_11865 [Acidimicrobiaceae bacterium]|nr:hypothetical protein [Acidimicrobiaceae bacterium]
MTQSSPVMMCFPFLALNESCSIGGWELVRADNAFDEGVWVSESYKQDSQNMLRCFRYGTRHFELINPTLVARAGRSFTGEPPTPEERNALIDMVAFEALDRNTPRVRASDEPPQASPLSFGWLVAENVEYWEMPVSNDNALTLSVGRRHKTRMFDTWGEDNPIVGPAVLADVSGCHVRIHGDMAENLYGALLSDSVQSAKLATAIKFFVDSWRNHSSAIIPDWTFDHATVISSQQTALEVLFGKNDTRSKAHHIVEGLRELLKRCHEAVADPDDVPKLAELCVVYMSLHNERKFYESQCFCDWAQKFTQIRNKTVHEGAPMAAPCLSRLPAEQDRLEVLVEVSDTADTVIRDAIRLHAYLLAQSQ